MSIGGFINPTALPDDELNSTSENSVQNKVIYNAIKETEKKIQSTLRPLPSVTVYRKDQLDLIDYTLDLVSCQQFVIYSSKAIHLDIKTWNSSDPEVLNNTYSVDITDSKMTLWFIYIQTGDNGDGSFIFTNGTRWYLGPNASYPDKIKFEHDQGETNFGLIVAVIE